MLRLLSLALLCWMAFAGNATPTSQLFDVRTLSLKNGLVQSSVRGVLQDSEGIIWLGTEAGVQQFDGLHLKPLSQLVRGKADPMLSTLWIYHILALDSGDIVFSTRRNGLLKYSRQSRTIEQFTASGFSPTLTDKTAFFETCQDSEGNLYAATIDGLLLIDTKRGSWRVLIQSQGSSRFSDVECRGDHLITRQDSSLLRWHKKSEQYTSFSIDSIADNPETLHIERLPDGQVLVAKQDGLFRINQGFTGLQRLWPQDTAQTTKAAVNHIYPENKDKLWLATTYQGLLLYSLETGEIEKRIHSNKNTPYSLSADHVLRIIKDHSGLLWASTYGVGIDRLQLNHNTMRTFYTHSDNSLIDNDITAISEGPDDTLWFATNRTGISKLSLKDMTVSNLTEQIIAVYQQYVPGELPYLSDIAVDSLNRLWFTGNHGIVRLNLTNGRSRFFAQAEQNPNGPTVRGRDIYIDTQGTLYITDRGGILRYRPLSEDFDRIKLSDPTSRDSQQRLWGIRQNSQGKLFVLGTYNLYRLNQQDRLDAVLDESQLKNAFGGRMSAFANNARDDIYIAAQGALIEVLMHQQEKPKINIYSGEALPDNYFYAVEVDNNGNPWLSTNNGVVQFNVADGNYHHFTHSDGILVQEFNGRSSYIRPNGHIIFGGIDGFVVIKPEQLIPNKNTPRLILSSYQVGSQASINELKPTGIVMNYDDHWLKFSFSALDYHSPQENQYAYFLEGFDPAWRNFGHQPEISYTGLPPGKYTLHARAATKRGDWHKQPLTIDLRVEPPFYRSTAAYLLYLVVTVALTGLFIWRRNHLYQERQRYISLIETSQERMRLALWGSGDSIWDWHIVDDQIFRSAIDFLGYDDNAFATSIDSFKALIHPQDLPHFEQELGEVLACHTAEYTAQFRMKNSAGNWVWVADQGKVVETTAGNKPVRLSGTTRDISELKHQEQQLQKLNDELEQKIEQRTRQYMDKNEELVDTLGTLKNTQDQLVESEKMASLGNLIAGISHEINTPVGVALTAATHNSLALEQLQQLFVERKLTVKDMEKGLGQLKSSNDLIESSIKRTAQLIQTFKQVAVDHDQQEWRIIEMPIYIADIIPTFQAQFANKNMQIEVLESDFFDIECAPGDLYQILSQLITNSAVHGFSDRKDGKIKIEVLNFKDHWQLHYQDDGKGMLNDTLSHIFEPFYTTRRGSGYTGLGMHLVYNIVNHSLGGSIECHSEPDQGCRFVMKFPLSKPDRPQPSMLQSLLHET